MKFTRLFEGKNIGDLFHLASIKNMQFIIKTNSLKFNEHYELEDYEYISLTRDNRLNAIYGLKGESACKKFKLIIDGNKLSDNYKIVPYCAGEDWEDEHEERVITNEIKNIFKYVKGVVVLTNLPYRKEEYERLGVKTLDDLKNYKPVRKTKEDFDDIYDYYDYSYISKNEAKDDYKEHAAINNIIKFFIKKGIKIYAQNVWGGSKQITDNLDVLKKCYFLDAI